MKIDNLLKKYNLKITNARINIISVLINEDYSQTANDINFKLQRKKIYINISTIYRNLETLYEKGLVEKFSIYKDKHSYILKKINHTHTIQCRICQKEIRIPCPMAELEEIINKETGFSDIDHDLKIKGICKGCRKKYI